MRKLYFAVTVLLTAAVVLQLYLAAVGVFSDPEDELFSWHGMNGRVVLPILALLTIITAALARTGKRTIWLSAIPLGLIILQTLIFIFGGVIFGLGPDDHAAPPLGATLFIWLHGLNGAAILLVERVADDAGSQDSCARGRPPARRKPRPRPRPARRRRRARRGVTPLDRAQREEDAMTTAALLALHAGLSLAAAALWLAAGFTAASAAHPPRVASVDSSRGSRSPPWRPPPGSPPCTVLLAGRGWWFVAEKVDHRTPVRRRSVPRPECVGLVRWWRRDGRIPLDSHAHARGGYAHRRGVRRPGSSGTRRSRSRGRARTPAVLLAYGLAWTVIAGRGRRAIAGFAGLLALLLVGRLGWSWLSDTAAPSIEATGAGHHGSRSGAAATSRDPPRGARRRHPFGR